MKTEHNNSAFVLNNNKNTIGVDGIPKDDCIFFLDMIGDTDSPNYNPNFKMRKPIDFLTRNKEGSIAYKKFLDIATQLFSYITDEEVKILKLRWGENQNNQERKPNTLDGVGRAVGMSGSGAGGVINRACDTMAKALKGSTISINAGLNNPNMEIRTLGNGSHSVIARVFNPHKKFYEHPEHINITARENAVVACWELVYREISIEDIEENWVLIGD